MIIEMDNYLINFEGKFEVNAPGAWSRKSGPEDHLILEKSEYEVIVIRRDDLNISDICGQINLEGYLELVRDNSSKLLHFDNVRMSSVEPFSTPRYSGKIMTYAFNFSGMASEITIFAFQSEAYFYIFILQAPVNCSNETLSDYFDVINSFKVLDENITSPKQDMNDMRYALIYDYSGKLSILIPDSWTNIIGSYRTETDYSIFVSSGGHNQVVGVSEIGLRKSDGFSLARVTEAVRESYPEPIFRGECAAVEINGMKALQYEEENSPQSVVLKFLNTVVEAGDAYYLISCWARPAAYGDWAGLFRYITDSFTVYGPGGFANLQIH